MYLYVSENITYKCEKNINTIFLKSITSFLLHKSKWFSSSNVELYESHISLFLVPLKID